MVSIQKSCVSNAHEQICPSKPQNRGWFQEANPKLESGSGDTWEPDASDAPNEASASVSRALAKENKKSLTLGTKNQQSAECTPD